MVNLRSRKFLMAVFVSSVFLINTGYTDADLIDGEVVENNRLAATTLSFSSRSTVNNQPSLQLFKTNGILPGGFDVASIRIKKDGRVGFKYRIETVVAGGDDLFCEALGLELIQGGRQKFKGPLPDFNLESSLLDAENEDWIFLIYLNQDDPVLSNKTCEFTFALTTFHQVSGEGGFHDETELLNVVLGGNW